MIGFEQLMPHWTEVRENRAFVSEIKFLVPLSTAAEIRDWARARLRPDPFGEGACHDYYRTTSLYYDTLDYDVLNRRGSYARSKYRIRRYGQAADLFLERKLKKHDLVSKRRSIIALSDLHRLDGIDPVRGWPGFWFHRRIVARDLQVACQISYHRTARLGSSQHGSIRLTIDEGAAVHPSTRLSFQMSPVGLPLTPNRAILELKYHVEVPEIFRELIDSFALVPEPVSKYRLAMTALGADQLPHCVPPPPAERVFHAHEV